MNGKSYSLRPGMFFKKYYCSKCGTKLETERTHRVVTKDDPDYYRYHDIGKFPRRDYDVYDYQFRCPDCGARQSYDDQRIIARMQKRHGHPVLPATETEANYEEDKKKLRRKVLVEGILLSLISVLFSALFFCLYNSNKSAAAYKGIGITFLLFAAGAVVGAIRRYAGSRQLNLKKSYSYDKEAHLKKLFAYSCCNRKLVVSASKCHCFHCKETLDSREITDYRDDGQTALCPNCGEASILPDSIDEPIDENTISEMNKYWY